MTLPLFAAFGQTVFMLLLGSVAVFLILLVLVQRGRGGGLAGALGGMGGSSAFGAKAGDVFTKITVVAATIWILLCIAATKMTPSEESLLSTGVAGSSPTVEEGPALFAPAGESEESSDENAADSTGGPEADTAADTAAEPQADTAAPAEDSGTE